MSEQQQISEQTQPGPADVASKGGVVPAVRPEIVPLPDVLRQIRRDSRREASDYLRQTEVPFGGE